MFLDGVKKTILISSWALAWLKQPRTPSNPRDITPQKGTHPPGPIQTSQTLDNPWCSTVPRPQVVQEIYYIGGTGFLRLPFSNFRYSLTLFSKFFASFPHGTCALSVSHRYLALDGIYHPLCAAIPNNTTQSCKLQSTAERESHPLCCPVPRDFGQAILQTHHNSSVWAVPASLAVTGGILVSFFSSA